MYGMSVSSGLPTTVEIYTWGCELARSRMQLILVIGYRAFATYEHTAVGFQVVTSVFQTLV